MAAYTIHTVQHIPVSRNEAWAFFSNPGNLAKITPPGMGFRVISKYHGDQVYAGQLIEYRVSPVLGIPLYWMTEITQVNEGVYFIDEQRFGPYALWHHQHHFKEIPAGVEMTDIVHYRMRFGWLGRLLHRVMVKRKLEEIFRYRHQAVEKIFGTGKT